MKYHSEVPGYPNYYINDRGEIYSRKSSKYLKHRIDKDGYHIVNLYNLNGVKTFKVHRLVAMVFISNPHNKAMVNHKDGNKSNNTVENLEWVTCTENTVHAFNLGLRKTPSGVKSKKSKLSDVDLFNIFSLRLEGRNRKYISEATGISPRTVVLILLGRRYREDFLNYRTILIDRGLEKSKEYYKDRLLR